MTMFASKDLAIAPREDGWDEPSNEPNPVLIAFRDSIAAFPASIRAESWLLALEALDAFGGFVHWQQPGHIYGVLLEARPDQIAHARRVLERLAAGVIAA